MRTLSATLLTAQESVLNTGGSFEFIWKLVLSRTSETTVGYDKTRILSMPFLIQEDTQTATVLLRNVDKAVNNENFEMYTAKMHLGYHTGVSRSIWVASTAYSVGNVVTPITVNRFQYRCTTAGTSHSSEPTFTTDLGTTVTETGGVVWEMDGNTGDEYSIQPPFKVKKQRFLSGIGTLVCQLQLIGLPDEMKLDLAESVYEPPADNTDVVKTIIDAIADGTLDASAPYGNYTQILTTHDSSDDLITSYIPADYFRIGYNDSRWDKIKEILAYTGTKMRPEDDGALHLFDPLTTGDTFDYEYKFRVPGSHVFFDKELANRFVSPNKVIVQSSEDHDDSFIGNATSTASFNLFPKTETLTRRLVSDAEGANIATARIESNEQAAERGAVTVPINVGQEIWDYIKVTDSQQGDSKIGNIRSIRGNIESRNSEGKEVFEMAINFGTDTLSPILPGQLVGEDLSVTVGRLVEQFLLMDSRLSTVIANQEIIVANQNILFDREKVPKWHITQLAIAPVQASPN